VKDCLKLLLLVFLALLVKPLCGFGQQQATRLEALVAAAQQAQAAHDFATAVEDYTQATKIEPGMPELWANLGLVQQQAEDIPAAIQSFEHANHLNPALYVPNLFLGIDFVRSGSALKAIPFLTKAERINKTDPQTPLALGRAYFALGKFSIAAREFAKATSLDPKLGAAWFGLGIARLNQVEADAHVMSIENKSSAFAGALYAESLQKQGRFSEAATLYRSLLSSRPQPPCLQSELGFSLLRLRDSKGASEAFAAERNAHPECSLALLGLARVAMDSGDTGHAGELLMQLWDRDHGFVDVNAGLFFEGLSAEKAAVLDSGDFSQSKSFPEGLKNALLAGLRGVIVEQDTEAGPSKSDETPESRPGSTAPKTAEDLFAAGQYALCSRRIKPVLAAMPADKLRLLAACSFFTGDNELAFSTAAALGALHPASPEALYWSIQANERLALNSLARFQQLEPDSARGHVLLGDIYYQLERYTSAEAEYKDALAIEPNDSAAMAGLATAYLSDNRTDQAMETARMALDHAPEDPEVNLILAEALVISNRFAEAEPFLNKSLKVKPQMLSHVHALIGKVDAETGRTREAIEQLKMGESSDENGSIHYLLARLYRQIGDDKDASDAINELKAIKQQRHDRGVKLVEDPDLSSLEASHGDSP
jgi:tetratricopeptide (TPR) repeat protein